MKSDKEYLNGIYEKAAKYDLTAANNNQKNRHIKWYTVTSFAAVLLVGILSVSLILSNRKTANQNADQDKVQYNNDIEMTNDLPRLISPFKIDIITIDEDGIQVLLEEAKLADAVISGKVIRNFLEDTNSYSEIMVETCYMGEINQDIIFINNKISDKAEEFIFTENEQVLLFIIKEESNTYSLTNINNGKMSYMIEAEGDGFYVRYDGVMIYERDLYSGVFLH